MLQRAHGIHTRRAQEISACTLRGGLSQVGEDEPACAGLHGAAHGDGHGLADELRCVIDDDHCAVGQETDGLVLVLAGLHKTQLELITGTKLRLQRAGEVVEIQNGNATRARDLSGVDVVGEQARIQLARESDDERVHRFVSVRAVFVDGDGDATRLPQLLHTVEPAFATLAGSPRDPY